MAALLSQNMNMLWASVVVEELCRNQASTFFVSPGNRNAPLIAALAHNSQAKTFPSMDERGAGFRALGYAKATGLPGVLVCTSGTALANYFPAVIEAARDELPLIILSADRPPELVQSDANQTIIQEGIYSGYCRESLPLPCPDVHYPLEALAAKICHMAQTKNGPVHINCRFRDPLIPVENPSQPVSQGTLEAAENYFSRQGPATIHISVNQSCPDLGHVKSIIEDTQRGLVVIGRLENGEEKAAAKRLATALPWPVFCDIASSLKGPVSGDRQIFSMDHPRTLALIQDYNPQTILQLGTGLVSKHYYASVLGNAVCQVIQVSPRQGHRDPSFKVTHKIHASIKAFEASLGPLEGHLQQDTNATQAMLQRVDNIEKALWKATPKDVLSFPLIANIVNQLVPAQEALFLANSTTVRAFDMAGAPSNSPVNIITNRGVSGIEGNMATSVGYAQGSGRRVTTVLGDVSFIHDLNSLAMVSQSTVPVIIMIINNQGGRIFERLPINDFPEIAHPMMTTPHGMDFFHGASQFGLPYAKAATPEELEQYYKDALEETSSQVIEVELNPETDLNIFHIRKSI